MATKCKRKDGSVGYLVTKTLKNGRVVKVCQNDPPPKKGYDPKKHTKIGGFEGEKRTGTDSSGKKVKMVFSDGKWQRA